MHLFKILFESALPGEEVKVPFSFVLADSLEDALVKAKAKLLELSLDQKLIILQLGLAEGHFKNRVI